MPQFVCPECHAALVRKSVETMACAECAHVFERRGGIWRFLTAARGEQLEPFVRQYRIVRDKEGRRPDQPEYYRRLPAVSDRDPHARDWEVRRETYRHLLGHVLAVGALPLRLLDVGAGSGWLSNRL